MHLLNEDRLLLLCNGKLQLKYAPGAKTLHELKNIARCRCSDSKTAKNWEHGMDTRLQQFSLQTTLHILLLWKKLSVGGCTYT